MPQRPTPSSNGTLGTVARILGRMSRSTTLRIRQPNLRGPWHGAERNHKMLRFNKLMCYGWQVHLKI